MTNTNITAHVVPPSLVPAPQRLPWNTIVRNRRQMPAPFAQNEATAALYPALYEAIEYTRDAAYAWTNRERGATRERVVMALASMDGVMHAMAVVHMRTVTFDLPLYALPGRALYRDAKQAALKSTRRA